MGYIIITGAAGGIGEETTRYLAEKGYELILIDLEDPVHLVDKLPENKINTFAVDVSNKASIDQFMEKVQSLDLEITGLVNLAGITRDRTLLKMTEAEWDLVIDINLKGTFLMIQQISGLMKDNGGSIINVGSTAAHHGNFGQTNYVASKGGVEAMTRTAARELARFNIRVNCIIPGLIATPMSAKIPDELKEQTIKQIPLQREGQPGDIAHLVEFLLSEKSSYITGSSIKIDGGLRM